MNSRFGAINAFLAFFMWGFFPIYWKNLQNIPTDEIFAHRIFWSTLCLQGILIVTKQTDKFLKIIRNKNALKYLCISCFLISSNWVLYIWAVNASHIVETGLGYFINPLLNVVLGIVFMKERLRKWQIISVLIAAVGILYLTIQNEEFPIIAIGLALTFGLYGFVRKIAPVESFLGLSVETTLLFIPATIYIFLIAPEGKAHLTEGSFLTKLLLVGTGPTTFIPLVLFANAARNLTLTTLGFFQYVAPTLQVLSGVLLYNEPFTRTHWISFGCIWLALGIYSVESLVVKRR